MKKLLSLSALALLSTISIKPIYSMDDNNKETQNPLESHKRKENNEPLVIQNKKPNLTNSDIKEDLERAVNTLCIFKENISTMKPEEKIQLGLEEKLQDAVRLLTEMNPREVKTKIALIEKFKEKGFSNLDESSHKNAITSFLFNQFGEIKLPEPFSHPHIYFTTHIDTLPNAILSLIFMKSFENADVQAFESISLTNKKWRALLVPESKIFTPSIKPSLFFHRSKFKELYFDHCMQTSKQFFKMEDECDFSAIEKKRELMTQKKETEVTIEELKECSIFNFSNCFSDTLSESPLPTFREFLMELGICKELMKEEEENIKAFLKSIHYMKNLFTNQVLRESSSLTKVGYQFMHPKGIYFGGLKNGKKEGKGALFSWSRKKFPLTYFGCFNEDEANGKGIRFWPNGNKYAGEFCTSKRYGKGTLLLKGTGTYEGDFINDKREGFGIMTFENGDVYTGAWKNDKANGKGCFVAKGDAYTYNGLWVDNHKSGMGTLEYQKGTYTGQWLHNRASGQGTIKFKDGNKYVGQMVNNSWEGKGVFTYADGTFYEGTFRASRFCGKGKRTFLGGSSYEGDFDNNQANGQGKLVFSNGFFYFGDFLNNKHHGQGTLYDKNGKKYFSGTFIDGQITGQGTLLINQKVISGEFLNGKLIKSDNMDTIEENMCVPMPWNQIQNVDNFNIEENKKEDNSKGEEDKK